MKKNLLKNIYSNYEFRFPVIASVIENNCPGRILYNDYENPTHFFVINKFGFCQEIYLRFDEKFVHDIILKMINSKKRQKLRCYAPQSYLQQKLNKILVAKKAERGE